MSSWTRLARWSANSWRPQTARSIYGIREISVVLRRNNWVVSGGRYRKKPEAAIIEDKPDGQHLRTIRDIKHYLKTMEIPQKLRMSLLKSRLLELVHDVDDYSLDPDIVPTVNAVFMHLYRVNNGETGKIMLQEDIYRLFEHTAQSLPRSGSFQLPEYMVTLTGDFLKAESPLPDNIMTTIVALGSSLKFSEFAGVLEYIVKNKKRFLTETFTKSVLDHLKERKEMDLAVFEAFLHVSASQNTPELVNDLLCEAFLEYAESLFTERNPRVHEYLDLERNVYRLQYVTSKVIDGAFGTVNTDTALKMLKLKAELNSVVSSDRDTLQIQKMLTKISGDGKSSHFADVKLVIFARDLDDETLANTLLMELAKQRDLFSEMRTSLSKFFVTDDVKFSSSLRMKASIMQAIEQSRDLPEDQLFSVIEAAYGPFADLTGNLSECYTDIVQVVMFSGCTSPAGPFMKMLDDQFKANYSYEPSIASFQFRIDRAIELDNAEEAFQLFTDSLKYSSTPWDESQDPSTLRTLNDLICIISERGSSITEIFPKFRKVKQHMTMQASAEAIKALAGRMMAEECVGDTIELLKRELPKIDKEAIVKIQVTPPWASAYRELFDTLHNFVITYDNEETHETNWVLYGELHKYFHVPYDSYMPALKYFCSVDRLNAALVIFSQIKRLNELHGSQNHNLPPLRDMYLFLLQTFGDKLYEEGVVEMHEYLKMDVHLPDQDIDLQNCVLNAYSNLQSVGKARDLFLAISANSKQNGGINEETIQIMIKTYTYSDMLYVKKFWNNLSLFGIFPDYRIYRQYLIAHVYHGMVEEAFDLVDEIDDYNLEFSSDLLLAMHNYCLDPKKQEEVVQWAMENHKEDWEKLKLSGLLKTASEYMPDTNLLTDGKTE